MSDRCHNRSDAGTALLIRALTPWIIQTGYPAGQQRRMFEFVLSNDYFSGSTWMTVYKAAIDATRGIEYSIMMTTITHNGVEFGLYTSDLPDQWFTSSVQQVIEPMFAGHKPEDPGRDIGDSAITEAYGIDGFAMATAPTIVVLVGDTIEEAIGSSRQIHEITLSENPNATTPLLGFMNVPTVVDIIHVGSTGILPVIDTAAAHRGVGIGMIGVGVVHPPFACFEKVILSRRGRYYQ